MKKLIIAFAFAFAALAPAKADPATCDTVTSVALVTAETADAWMGNHPDEEHLVKRRKEIVDEIHNLQRDMNVPLLTLQLNVQVANSASRLETFRARELSTGYAMLDAMVGRGPAVRAATAEELLRLRPQAETMLKGMVTRQQLPAEAASAMTARMAELLGQEIPPGQAARVVAYELRMEYLHKVHAQLQSLLAAGPLGVERTTFHFLARSLRFMPLAECEKPNPERVVTLTLLR